uniref:PX domain-containing protein n=1 Tax=Arion vulgaris TaxID=1028688 RepID=A0A0B7ALR2_9EUPU
MSEIDIRRKVKNEENVVAFSPAKVSVLSAYGNVVENGKPASVSEFEGNNVLSGEYFNSSEHSSDPSEIDEVGDAKENDKERKSHNVRDDNDKFCQDISTATPVMHKDTIIDSRQVSDKTPLLNEMSSVNGSSTDLNTEGDNETSEASCECSYLGDRDSDRSSLNSMSITSQRKDNLMMPGSIQVPIVGHEIVESRTRFTVFKIHVKVQGDDSGWFIFRRYSDFVHLNDQLKILYPNFRLSLPPKRWFRSNFDFDFLEERLLGLQAFVHNVTGHSDICNSKPSGTSSVLTILQDHMKVLRKAELNVSVWKNHFSC